MVLGHFYFSRNGNSWLLTNDLGEYVFLTDKDFMSLCQKQTIDDPDKYHELCDKNFVFDTSVESYIRCNELPARNAGKYLFEGTNLFIIAITNACNNRCIYCQANGEKEICNMQEDVAEQIIQFISRCPSKSLTIEFQGGEPLLNYHIIQYIINRSKELLAHKQVQFTVVSNLALLTEEIASFFSTNHVSVSTSLDGPAILHNLNRPAADGTMDSFDRVMKGIEFLKNAGIVPGAIETTTSFSLTCPEEIVDTYVNHGFKHLFLRPLTRLGAAARNWDQIGYTADEYLAFYKRALHRIIQYNLQGVHIMDYLAAMFLKKILTGIATNYMELRSPCGACLGQMAFTANGNIYTCDEGRMMAEMGDETFQIGNVFDNDYNSCIESPGCKAVSSVSLLDTLPGCCDCVYKPYCGVCPVINYALHGSITSNSKERCMIYKGILNILFDYLREEDSKVLDIFYQWCDYV